MTAVMQEYIGKLKQIQKEKGLGLSHIAQELEMDEQYLRMIMLGELIPTDTDSEKIAEYVLSSLS